MRAVLFMFAILETVFNLFCMAYHISGFTAVNISRLGWFSNAMHYMYLLTFYLFTVLTLFASIKLCTGHPPNVKHEIYRTCIASVTFIVVAILTMYDAEHDFHLLYLDRSGHEDEDAEKPLHPFFKFQRSQSISALICGVLYMLHATIVIDVYLSVDDAVEDTSEESLALEEEAKIMPIELFIFGEYVQKKLEKFAWFREFSAKGAIHI